MQYHSTRGLAPAVDSAEAVLTGLAPDGGLYMPMDLPEFDWQKCVSGDTLSMATQILSAFLPDIPEMEISSLLPPATPSALKTMVNSSAGNSSPLMVRVLFSLASK